MRARSNERMKEALAYLVGFTAVAVPGTIFLLSSEIHVAGWTLVALIIAEFSAAEAMRSGLLRLYIRGRHYECR